MSRSGPPEPFYRQRSHLAILSIILLPLLAKNCDIVFMSLLANNRLFAHLALIEAAGRIILAEYLPEY